MILLDTHVLLWLTIEPDRLSRSATSAIRKSLSSGGIAIASISLWEIAMMIALGRIKAHGAPERWIEELVAKSGVIVKEISATVAALSTQVLVVLNFTACSGVIDRSSCVNPKLA